MARMGFKQNDVGKMLNLVIIPQTALETDALFTLINSDSYPVEIKGRIIFNGNEPPQIILYGNNVTKIKD